MAIASAVPGMAAPRMTAEARSMAADIARRFQESKGSPVITPDEGGEAPFGQGGLIREAGPGRVLRLRQRAWFQVVRGQTGPRASGISMR